jgi:hypothetical protein
MKRVPNEPTPSRVPDEMVLEQNARELTGQAGPGAMTFADFKDLAIPSPKPLLGTIENCYLAEGGVMILASDPHVGKTTLALDLIAHMASGTDWLGITVLRPVRILVIENEGPKAMFQRQVRRKIETWEGEPFADNVYLSTDRWGDRDLRMESDREFVRGFCAANAIDLVIGDTISALGSEGNGGPGDTKAFQGHVRQSGLGAQAWLLLHHFNKTTGLSGLNLNRMTGDWAKWPDTVAYLESGGSHTTKLGWPKSRFVEDKPEDWTILKHIVESRSFAIAGKEKVEDVRERDVLNYLSHVNVEGPTTRQIVNEVDGNYQGKLDAIKRLADSGKIVNKGDEHHSRWYVAETTDEDRTEQIETALDLMPEGESDA